ncbi:hypothetical protein HYPSUDRAFT_58677 [Hypholoma sublateritium FD-334 SS-4]|uniref:Uncharacterized protein n=1 Tax=Hypholoma sublateritium (strain FD-334 SS-4) TaxID=945553 RepID=A0A0D2N991_HYPSF|nr:hypothetical protein HYPSUDRAFT_58677 [Hypholoma sublateritium FD-334 SS-4]
MPDSSKVTGHHAQKPSGRYKYKEGRWRSTCESCRDKKRKCPHNTNDIKEHPDFFLGERIGGLSDDIADGLALPDEAGQSNLVGGPVANPTRKLRNLAVSQKKRKKWTRESSILYPVVEDTAQNNGRRVGRMVPMGGMRRQLPATPKPELTQHSIATVKKPTHYGKNLPPEKLHAFHIDYMDRDDMQRAQSELCSPTPPSPRPSPGSSGVSTILHTKSVHFEPNLENTLHNYTCNSTDNQVSPSSNPTVSDRIDHVTAAPIPGPSEAIHAAMPTLRENDIPPLPAVDSEDEEMLSQSPPHIHVAQSLSYKPGPEPCTSFLSPSFSCNVVHPHILLDQPKTTSVGQPPDEVRLSREGPQTLERAENSSLGQLSTEETPMPSLLHEATPTSVTAYAAHPDINLEPVENLSPAEPLTDEGIASYLSCKATPQAESRSRLYRLPGYFRLRTYGEACEIRDQLVADAVEDDESAEYHFGVADQYRARSERNRRRAADLDHILSPGPCLTATSQSPPLRVNPTRTMKQAATHPSNSHLAQRPTDDAERNLNCAPLSNCKRPREGHPRSGCPYTNLPSLLSNIELDSSTSHSPHHFESIRMSTAAKAIVSERYLQPIKQHKIPLSLPITSEDPAAHISPPQPVAAVFTSASTAMKGPAMKSEVPLQPSISPFRDNTYTSVFSADKMPVRSLSQDRNLFLSKLSGQALAVVYLISKANSDAIVDQAVALELKTDLVVSQNDYDSNFLIIFDNEQGDLRPGSLLHSVKNSAYNKVHGGTATGLTKLRAYAAAVVVEQ